MVVVAYVGVPVVKDSIVGKADNTDEAAIREGPKELAGTGVMDLGHVPTI